MGLLKPNNGPFVEIGNEVDDITENVRCDKTPDFFGWQASYTAKLCDFFAGDKTAMDELPKSS
jgi:hypothetical protein